MPVRYDQDTKAKAIRLVREHAGDYPSEYAAITAVARRLGMSSETLRKWLRKWLRQAAVDEGQAPGVTTEALPTPGSALPRPARRARAVPAALCH